MRFINRMSVLFTFCKSNLKFLENINKIEEPDLKYCFICFIVIMFTLMKHSVPLESGLICISHVSTANWVKILSQITQPPQDTELL